MHLIPYPHNQLFKQLASSEGKTRLPFSSLWSRRHRDGLQSLPQADERVRIRCYSFLIAWHLDICDHPSLVFRENTFPINIAFPLLPLKGSTGLSPVVGTLLGEIQSLKSQFLGDRRRPAQQLHDLFSILTVCENQQSCGPQPQSGICRVWGGCDLLSGEANQFLGLFCFFLSYLCEKEADNNSI